MPLYEPDRIEYEINTGRVQIVNDAGRQVPAYWARPTLGSRFSGIVLIHDWWGLNDPIRRMANLFAQLGYYVIAPDLFSGQTATRPQQAAKLVESLGAGGYTSIDRALTVLETHHHSNRHVAAIGMGMGGSLAFEAAITRHDLEAAIAYGGFPKRYLGRFRHARAAICAIYGEKDNQVPPETIQKLRHELADSAHGMTHELHIMPGMGHDLLAEMMNGAENDNSRQIMRHTLGFLDTHLTPSRE